MISGDGAFALMSIARMIMKNTKKNAAVYSTNASVASKANLTRRMFDMENVSRASHKPNILMMHTACPVRQIGRKMAISHDANARRWSENVFAGRDDCCCCSCA